MRWCFVWLGLFCMAANAQTGWFTVTGNPADASVDTVQVNPVAIATDWPLKTMLVRVSRAEERRNWEGVPYRSYESRVRFNCRARKAHYLYATFYMAPLWQGEPHQRTDYDANPRPMLFLDAQPNPTERIVRAACRAGAG
ncbi:surface-adhesin E family protein [Variovorax sp. KK3]|uniref:surface-adhesin E family protein n=1 Tax=Variovorax sp. KK3 TaxID=1855728 RepID=UPI00097C8D7B|nr:surface-adhesin E family protein [Variovorax sp. KK3]